jgi:hypothetical protein
LEDQGLQVKALDNKPVLHADLFFDFKAFNQLNSSRQLGFSSGPIPLTEIYAYMQIFGIESISERAIFLERMRILDNAYLEHLDAKSASKESKQKTKKVRKK